MCDLTQGYELPCRDSMGGVTQAIIIQHEHLADAQATVADLEVTALTLPPNKQGWAFDLDTEKSSGTSNPTGSRENWTKMFEQEVNLILMDRKKETRNIVSILIQKKVAIILKDANGNFEIYGYHNGLMLETGEAGTGTSNEDRNGYSLTFTGREQDDAYIVDPAIIPTLLVPAAS
jgi:hypothetical protein